MGWMGIGMENERNVIVVESIYRHWAGGSLRDSSLEGVGRGWGSYHMETVGNDGRWEWRLRERSVIEKSISPLGW